MQHPLFVALVWVLSIAVVIVVAGAILFHWFALGLAVGSAAANRFLLQALAFVAAIAAVGAGSWYWWRKF